MYRINPLGVVTGKSSGKKRLILDLSSPHGSHSHSSINSLIPKEDYSLSYVKVDDAVQILKRLGRGSYMNKLDVADAFKVLSMSPDLWQWYGFEFDNFMYFYTRLTFGSRSSPYLFSLLSEAIQYIAQNNYGVKYLLYLLDDFLAIDRTEIEAHRSMAVLTMIFNILCVPLNKSKTTGPCTVIDYLGITLDSEKMEA